MVIGWYSFQKGINLLEWGFALDKCIFNERIRVF